MGRTALSREVCVMLEWQSPSGTLKDIACRDMLRALDKIGAICLPPPQKQSRTTGVRHPPKHLKHNMEPVVCTLGQLAPIRLELAEKGDALAEFKSLIDQFHYLGYDRTVGENIKYVARGRNGEILALLLFGSAAWSCADRDAYIGWSKEQRSAGLQYMTNNTRFLIPQYIRVPCLASHVLSLAERRISRDWETKYGHPLAAIETFVEQGRFRGTVYKSANWLLVGSTSGRGRDGGHNNAILSIKDIYLRPLCRRFREILKGERQFRSQVLPAASK